MSELQKTVEDQTKMLSELKSKIESLDELSSKLYLLLLPRASLNYSFM